MDSLKSWKLEDMNEGDNGYISILELLAKGSEDDNDKHDQYFLMIVWEMHAPQCIYYYMQPLLWLHHS